MVEALAASRRMKGAKAEAAANCSEVYTIAVALNTLVIESPESPKVLVYCATIIASSTLVCTEDEEDSLADLDVKFEQAVASLEAAINEAQEELESLTGATLSPEEIATASGQTEPTSQTTITY